MTKVIAEENVVSLPSGKDLYAYSKVIGINDEADVYYGFDGLMEDFCLSVTDTKATAKEQLELADIMLDRWSNYRQKVLARIAEDEEQGIS